MNEENVAREQHVLRSMRKVLGSIIRDTTPESGMASVLSEKTVEEIKACFALISVREAELQHDGYLKPVPVYADQPRSATVIPIGQTGSKRTRPLPEDDGGDDAA